MKNRLSEYIERIRQSHRNTRRYVAVLLVLALVTTLGVNWGLHRNGISFTRTADYTCGLGEHTHMADCYSQVLVCGQEETASIEGHTHTASCYQDSQTLVCAQEEHTHGETCFDEEGNLICESQEHTHTENCYETEHALICTIEEQASIEGHTHTDACYEEQITCGQQEHTHSTACLGSDPGADLETADIWEQTLPESEEMTGVWAEDLIRVAKSQLGYTESTENYILSEDGKTCRGYTRYGAWYGNEYGDWCAMFAAFCLHYADIPREMVPINSGCEAWITELKSEEVNLYRFAGEYLPEPGDLVFFDWNGDGLANHVGIVSELKYDDEEHLIGFKTIEGNASDTVKEKEYELTDESLLGYLELPENPELAEETDTETDGTEQTDAEPLDPTQELTQTAETEHYTVTVTYTLEAQLPEAAQLQVIEYDSDSEEYKAVCEQTGEVYDWLLDISFFADGAEVEPAAAVSISVVSADSSAADEEAFTTITHFAEDGTEVLEEEKDEVAVSEDSDGGSEISFELSSLSLVAGTTYHPATVVSESSWTGDTGYNKDFLIYTVSGDYVYFLANSSGTPVTFRVALSDIVKKEASAATEATMTTLGQTSYFQDTITGTIISEYQGSYAATLGWSNLIWHHNGHGNGADGSLRQLSTSGTRNYLQIRNGTLSLTYWQDVYSEQGSESKYTVFSERAMRYFGLIPLGTTTYYLTFDGTRFTGSTRSDGSDLTIAQVGTDYTEPAGTSGNNGKTAVYTGSIDDMPLGFYSVCVGSSGKLEALPGVSYTIYREDGSIAGVVTTSSEMRIDISALNLPNGSYTMKMTSAPEGYVCDEELWSFNITDTSKTLSLKNESGGLDGIIIVNPDSNLTMDKTASVSDYENRVYQVDLSAKSKLVQASIEDLSINFVVDQSNSMLFPSGLKEVGEYFTVEKTSNSGSGSYKGTVNWQNGNLSTSKVYYVIARETSSSDVYALWYDSTDKIWKYQDASFYAKAFYGTDQPDKIKTTNVVTYPTASDKNYNASLSVSGGNLMSDNNMAGTGFQTDLRKEDVGTQKTYMVYEAVDEYNRLHYLEQSLSDLLQMLAAMNPEAEVTLDCFTNEIKSCTASQVLGRDYGNGQTGLDILLKAVGDITTDGGTRQDIALEHAYTTHQKNNTATNKYLVLITDGAPAVSSGSGVDTGKATDTSSSDGTVYECINYQADQIKDGGTTLVTIGLAMQNVESGSKSMRYIATDGPSTSASVSGDHGTWWFQPQNSSDLMSILCDQILNQIVDVSKVDPDWGTVVDYISDSFYPVNPATKQPVESGTRIDAAGNVVESGGIGTIKKAEDGSWYVEWDKTEVTGGSDPVTTTVWTKGETSYNWRYGNSYTANGKTYTWQGHDGVQAYWASETVTTEGTDNAFNGRVYLKAKEDFIGGNAINTNKKATMKLDSGGTYEFERPTVNVHLLDMNSLSTEVTVYKGDRINEEGNAPLDSVKYFYSNVEIQKLVSGEGDVLNRVGSTAEQGCKADTFTIGYATGVEQLSAEQWKTLQEGGVVTVPYTYDSADGEVGYFAFKLEKTGNTADFAEHEATEAKGTSEAVETYTLTITYVAYKLGEEDRPGRNEYNGDAGPGTEVGGKTAGEELKSGKGTVESENVHRVYVIDGTIRVWKEITKSLKSSEPQTFTFILCRQTTDENGNPVSTPVGEKTVTIEANSMQSSGYAEWTNLERGVYVVTEESSDVAVIKSITVKEDSTNCYSAGSGTTAASFTLGNDTNDENVIGKAENAVYTSYTGTPNGVLGEAVVTNTKKKGAETSVDVTKVWSGDDKKTDRRPESVTVWLYRDGVITDQSLTLNEANGWKGSFTGLPLYSDPDNEEGRYTYTVAEEVPDGYEVSYEIKTSVKGENGATEDRTEVTVTNTMILVYEFPKTGGFGATAYAAGGFILMGAALLLGCSMRRRRERRVE